MMNTVKEISRKLGVHYAQKFAKFGATPQGVDWGPNSEDHRLRLDRMLAVLEYGVFSDGALKPTILDVGCGYGSLLDMIQERRLPLKYCGIDMCVPMIEEARSRHESSEWLAGDVLELEGERRFDYVVCNGILTQKLEVSFKAMDRYLQILVTQMFDLCRIGVAFNVMTTHVNFMAPNLYYRNPTELLGWCMSALTPRIRIDHAYPMFEYTVYLYREDAPGLQYGAHRNAAK
jgi:SAM-dependent methyltransferase